MNEPVPGNLIEVGEGNVQALRIKLGLAPGLGQLWMVHSWEGKTIVLGQLDIQGRMRWSVIEDPIAFRDFMSASGKEITPP